MTNIGEGSSSIAPASYDSSTVVFQTNLLLLLDKQLHTVYALHLVLYQIMVEDGASLLMK
jgi:hypothetical protein